MNFSRRLFASCLAAPMLPVAASGPSAKLRVAMGRDENDRRYDFARDLLQLVLEASQRKVELVPVTGRSNFRIERELVEGELDVAILPSIGERPAGVLPVRVPIRRGLLGVRLLMARKERLPALAAVRTLGALQRGFSLGYGSDWLDLDIMRKVGFRVVTSATYTGLFNMLRAGRFDFLSRGLSEVWGEVDNPALMSSDLAIVPGIALYQPLDDYFHLGNASTEWAEVLQQGLATVLRDGRYATLFQQHFGAAFRRAGMAQRRVLLVTGYGVELGTPLEQFDVLELRGTEGVLKAPAHNG